MNKKIICVVNNIKRELFIDVRISLLEMLRDILLLKGTKQGCGTGECGACTVIVNGMVVDSCIFLAVWADGKEITTIEGIQNKDGSLSKLQKNFIKSGAIQCGFCTPGMVMSSSVLLNKNPNPTKEDIRRGMSGNLCRCTGYQKILEAIENTVKEKNEE